MATRNAKYDKVFAAFDTDNDGKITKSELGAALARIGRNRTDQELTAMMTELDKDANGIISRNEFYQMMEAEKAKEQRQMQDAFNVFDKDGSGKISASELKATLAQLQLTVSDKDVQDMIAAVDLNKDGEVSLGEFQKMLANL